MEAPTKCEKCGSTNLKQDEDTLDTWFSSALWPFSTLGWPDTENPDYKRFYPTNVLVTGFDIITFWVSRMMTQGLEFTDVEPFKDTLIHGIVRDSQGRKMSKTLGNGVDPLDVIEQYGADAIRFSVLSGTTMGNDVRYMPEKLEQASNFANKIWNAAKYVIMSCENIDNSIIEANTTADGIDWNKVFEQAELTIEDKWMIGKLNKLIEEVSANIEKYDLGIAVDNLYGFIWNEFCDWFIEMSKTRLNGEDEKAKVATSITLQYALRTLLKLLHPFMPFVTTEIYNHLKAEGEGELMLSSWPAITASDYKAEIDFVETMKDIIVKVRNIRTTMNVHPSKKVKLIFVTTKFATELKEAESFVCKLAFGNEIAIQEDNTGIDENAVSIPEDEINLYMPFNELVDVEEEKKRLEGELAKLEGEVKRSQGILNNKGFLAKAPEAKVNEEKEKLEKYTQMLNDIKSRLAKM
jgi:valyl-tRNA synthetase